MQELRGDLTSQQIKLIEQLFEEFLWNVPGGGEPYSLFVTDFEAAETLKNVFLHWLKTGEANMGSHDESQE